MIVRRMEGTGFRQNMSQCTENTGNWPVKQFTWSQGTARRLSLPSEETGSEERVRLKSSCEMGNGQTGVDSDNKICSDGRQYGTVFDYNENL